MKISSKLPDHAAVVNSVLEGFVLASRLLVESGVIPPDPMDVKGIEYRLEPVGEEDWKLGNEVIRDGWGDCEDLAIWRAGGLRATGEDPEAAAIVVQSGPNKLHCVVQRSDGTISDPSHDLWRRQRARHR